MGDKLLGRELFYITGEDIFELLNNAGRYDLVKDKHVFEDIINEVSRDLYTRKEELLTQIVREICEYNYGVKLD